MVERIGGDGLKGINLYTEYDKFRIINKYNEILKYFRPCLDISDNDNIKDIERGLIFEDKKTLFWDYLISNHAEVEGILSKEEGQKIKAVHCVKFILNSGKEFTFLDSVGGESTNILMYKKNLEECYSGTNGKSYWDIIMTELLPELNEIEGNFFRERLDKRGCDCIRRCLYNLFS